MRRIILILYLLTSISHSFCRLDTRHYLAYWQKKKHNRFMKILNQSSGIKEFLTWRRDLATWNTTYLGRDSLAPAILPFNYPVDRPL